jgi:hypothetical protein
MLNETLELNIAAKFYNKCQTDVNNHSFEMGRISFVIQIRSFLHNQIYFLFVYISYNRKFCSIYRIKVFSESFKFIQLFLIFLKICTVS